MNRSRFLTLIAGGKKKPFDADRFVLLVDSEESGVSGSDQFEITGAEVSTGTTFPVRFSPEGNRFDFTDVTVDVSDPTITFPTAGRWFVQIGQPFERIQFNNSGDRLKVVSAPLQYGNIAWSSFLNAFNGCANMGAEPSKDTPIISPGTVFRDCFFGCTNFNQDVTNWNMFNASRIDRMFRDATNFNQNLSSWNISNITRMDGIFRGSGMSCENYTDTLVEWWNKSKDNNEPLNVDATDQLGMTFATSRDGGANYANAGEARNDATTPVADGGLGWTISGDTVQTNC